jgi:low affinity Fe/Cu permease
MKSTEPKPIEAKRKFARLHFFEKFSSRITKATGSNAAIITAFSIIVLWLFWGLFEDFSENWKLVFIISTTIITFLMVFIIQKSRNKDALAIQLKLNELVAAHDLASNRLVDVENMTEAELKVIQKYYSRLSDFTKNDENLQQSHSIDETEVNHDVKNEMEEGLSVK